MLFILNLRDLSYYYSIGSKNYSTLFPHLNNFLIYTQTTLKFNKEQIICRFGLFIKNTELIV